MLDYSSQQLKLMPMLATCYALHFTSRFLVEQYAEMKRTKEEDIVADVHALSAGKHPLVAPISRLASAQEFTALNSLNGFRLEVIRHKLHGKFHLHLP